MAVIIDTVSATPLRPRHPEKANRPDALSPPKPDWIRVRAPTTRGYADTRAIVKENGLVTARGNGTSQRMDVDRFIGWTLR